MPNNYDFSELKGVKEIFVAPQGWISPLFVEYGLSEDIITYGTLSYYWRVKGTTHTFLIPAIRMDFLSSGDYKKHFEESLEVFRKDYIEWKNKNFDIVWMKEYEKQFSKFIII